MDVTILLLLLLLFRVLNSIFGLLTLLRALTLGMSNAKFLAFGIPNIKNHISSNAPKLKFFYSMLLLVVQVCYSIL